MAGKRFGASAAALEEMDKKQLLPQRMVCKKSVILAAFPGVMVGRKLSLT